MNAPEPTPVPAAPASEVRPGEILGLASHDLRTPLNSLVTWLKLMSDAPTPAERDRARDIVVEQIDALTRLADELQDCGALVESSMTLDLLTTELSSVLRSAVDRLRPVAIRRGLEIEVRNSDGEAWIGADIARLQSAIEAFAGHAIRQIPRPGPWVAWVEVRAADATLVLAWPKGHEDMVKPLAECGRHAHRPTGTLALGLAWEIIALHGGRVSVERENGEPRVVLSLPLLRRI